jgi:hypothetical protein
MNAPLVQLVEDHKAVWGKHFTVSFWYKSNKETYYNIWNGTSQIHFLVPSSDGAWKKWEQTYKLKENGAYFRLEFYSHTINMTSGSYLELAQVQIELGKVATPFEHRSFGEELALCKRYYEKSFNYDDAPANGSTTTNLSTNAGRNFCEIAIWSKQASRDFEVEKRASPTITRYGNSQGYWGYLSIGTSAPASDNTFAFHQNLIVQTDSKKSVCANNQVSGNPLWGIIGHWTAEAEL